MEDCGNLADMLLAQPGNENVLVPGGMILLPNQNLPQMVMQPQGYYHYQQVQQPHLDPQTAQEVQPRMSQQAPYAVQLPNPHQQLILQMQSQTYQQLQQGAQPLGYRQTAQVGQSGTNQQPSYEAPLDQISHQPVQAQAYQLPPQQVIQPQQVQGPVHDDMDDVMEIIGKEAELNDSSYDSLLRNLAGITAETDVLLNNQQLADPVQRPDSTAVTMGTAALTNHTPSPFGSSDTLVVVMPQPGSCLAVAGMQLANQIVPPETVVANPVAAAQPSLPNLSSEIVDLTESNDDGNQVAANQVTNRVSSTNKKIPDVPATKPKSKAKTTKKKRPVKSKSAKLSSLETDPKKTKTSDSAAKETMDDKTEGGDEAPDQRKLLVKLFYQSHLLYQSHQVKKDGLQPEVCSRGGYLVFYKKPCQFEDSSIEGTVTRIEFPQPGKESEHWSDKCMKATQNVLDALTKGLYIFCDDVGNVYTRRFCKSFVYCYSTEHQLGFDPVPDNTGYDLSSQQLPKRYVKRLPQSQKILVFDRQQFDDRLRRKAVGTGTLPEVPLITFTFGQTWDLGKPLSNCLVSMKVTPLSARWCRKYVNGGTDESWDSEHMTIAESLSTLSLSSGEGAHSGPSGKK